MSLPIIAMEIAISGNLGCRGTLDYITNRGTSKSQWEDECILLSSLGCFIAVWIAITANVCADSA